MPKTIKTINTNILRLWIHFLGKKHDYINLSAFSFILEGVCRTGRLTERNENLFPFEKNGEKKNWIHNVHESGRGLQC